MRKFPRDVRPASFVVAGRQGQPAEKKSGPAWALSKTLTTASLMKRKTLLPAGTTKMKKAKRSWSPIPHGDHPPVDVFPVARKQARRKGQNEDAAEADAGYRSSWKLLHVRRRNVPEPYLRTDLLSTNVPPPK